MTPAARIKATIDILSGLGLSRVPMDSTIGDYMRFRRYIGSKDRAEIVERVYSTVRAKARLGWWLEKSKVEDTARNRVLASLILAQGLTANRIDHLFDDSKYGAEELTEAERAFVQSLEGQELEHPDMDIAVAVECPPQAASDLQALFGESFADEMRAMLTPASLDLRVNVHMVDVDKVQKQLSVDGVETDKTPFSPFGLRTQGKAYLATTKPFAKGWIDIQDEGSQLIALLCGASAGQQVLDYCAGAGGKTLALANMMNIKGRIVAMDTEANRLAKAKERFRRARVSDIIEIRPLSDERHRKWLRRQKETFDVVLTDVPCSGSGTWRRNPDMRWRDYGPSRDELIEIQAQILEKVAGTVKPGGRLVYATCSLYREENEDQIENFLKNNPKFRVMPLAEAWPLEGNPPNEGPYMRLSPRVSGTDGFFAAILTC